jgi:hypothetical protein
MWYKIKKGQTISLTIGGCVLNVFIFSSVPDPEPDPDPPDPHVFGPPGSGSGSFYHHAKIIRKTLIPYIL